MIISKNIAVVVILTEVLQMDKVVKKNTGRGRRNFGHLRNCKLLLMENVPFLENAGLCQAKGNFVYLRH